jgi:hypothetical protein
MAWEPTEIAKALRLAAQPNGGKSLRHSMGDQSAEAASVGVRSRLALAEQIPARHVGGTSFAP